MMQELEHKYIENFLKDFKAQNLSEQEQSTMMELVSDRLHDTAVSVLIGMLDEEGRERFASALEKKPVQENEISEIAAGVPGLQPALELALAAEYEEIKRLYSQK